MTYGVMVMPYEHILGGRVAAKQRLKIYKPRNFDPIILNFAKFCENKIINFPEIPNQFRKIFVQIIKCIFSKKMHIF